MARATQPRSSDAPRDAIALLKQDHRTVEQLFTQFEDAEEGEQGDIAERVCQLLTVHAQIEEEILYPAAKEAFAEKEDDDMVYEAEVEHATAKDLIAKIEAMTPEDESFKATVKVLSEYIKHHVKEEEGELFPELKKTELDLKEMGGQLMNRKLELMEELGIEAEESAEATPKRSRSPGSSRSAAAKSGARRRASNSKRGGSRASR
jgi:hemerythrin superfamily protein